MSDKLKSRKFWMALLGAVLPIIAQLLTDEIMLAEALQASVAVIVSYLFSQGYVDGQVGEKKEHAEAPSESASE